VGINESIDEQQLIRYCFKYKIEMPELLRGRMLLETLAYYKRFEMNPTKEEVKERLEIWKLINI